MSAAAPQLSISNAFRGKHVLVTGASGFVGKCVVEKMLRDLPDIEVRGPAADLPP